MARPGYRTELSAPLTAEEEERLVAVAEKTLAATGLGPVQTKEAFFASLRLDSNGNPLSDGKDLPNDVREAARIHGDELDVEPGEWYDGIPGAPGTRRIAAADATAALGADDDDDDDDLVEEKIASGDSGSGFCLESPRMAKLDNFVDDEGEDNCSALPPWLASATDATYPGEVVANAAAADAKAALGDDDDDDDDDDVVIVGSDNSKVKGAAPDVEVADEESHTVEPSSDRQAPTVGVLPDIALRNNVAETSTPDEVDAVEVFALDPAFDYDAPIKLTPKSVVTADPSTWH